MEKIKNYNDFPKLRDQLTKWRKRFPMFAHDVKQFDTILEKHMKLHMDYIIKYKQTKRDAWLVKAQEELDHINRIITAISKVELIALLSKG